MHTFAATYITGLGELVETALTHEIQDIEIVGKDDGFIIFKTARKYEELLHTSYINNLFNNAYYEAPSSQKKSVHAVVKGLLKTIQFSKIHGRTFRLMVMQGSKLEHVTKEIANALKDKISKQTGLQFSPLKADIEFWCLLRNNGSVMFGYKKEGFEAKISVQKGELRPRIAELLVMASRPKAEDVFLDPFAGYGSIPAARIRLEPFKKIILVEKKGLLVEALKRRFKSEKDVNVLEGDSLKLNTVSDLSIDVIVTDPPWGLFEEIQMDMPVFYTKMLTECSRVLKENGRAVILSGQPEAMQIALGEVHSIQSVKDYTTLINGKKATIFVLEKVKS